MFASLTDREMRTLNNQELSRLLVLYQEITGANPTPEGLDFLRRLSALRQERAARVALRADSAATLSNRSGAAHLGKPDGTLEETQQTKQYEGKPIVV